MVLVLGERASRSGGRSSSSPRRVYSGLTSSSAMREDALRPKARAPCSAAAGMLLRTCLRAPASGAAGHPRAVRSPPVCRSRTLRGSCRRERRVLNLVRGEMRRWDGGCGAGGVLPLRGCAVPCSTVAPSVGVGRADGAMAGHLIRGSQVGDWIAGKVDISTRALWNGPDDASWA